MFLVIFCLDFFNFLAAPARERTLKNGANHMVFTVDPRSPLWARTTQRDRKSERLRCTSQLKSISYKKASPRRAQKMIKHVRFWSQFGSQNRLREPLWRHFVAVAGKSEAKSAPRAPEDDFGVIFQFDRYPGGIRGVSRGSNFARLGPWRRTIIKEIEYKQLKHRI